MNFKSKILNKLYSPGDIENNNYNNIIYGMWIGEELSLFEQLSIFSFLKNGHKYVLYTYEDVKNIPEDVEVRNGNEILDGKYISEIKDGMSLTQGYSTFSNWFRYTLLYKLGGWWADLDMVCLKPLDFKSPYVFSQVNVIRNCEEKAVNPGIIKSLKGSQLFKFYADLCEREKGKVDFGDTGPFSFYHIIKKYGLKSCIYPPEVFEPDLFSRILESDVRISSNTYTIHLANQRLVARNIDKNEVYDSDSLIEKLKRKYL